VTVYYASTSRRLADDVRRLLLRLGFTTRLQRARKNGYRDSWHVYVTTAVEQARFLRVVGCHGDRGDCIDRALEILAGIKANPNVDLVPWEVAARVKAAASVGGVTHRQIAEGLDERYCGSYLLGSANRPRRFSRERLRKIGEIIDDSVLVDLGTSDVFWDRVVEIVPLGEQPTFDATVEDTHNFIADGVLAHNSLEQDADVVLFLYRDEVYNDDSPDRGTAEVLVSKHRSGPTGKVRLAWLEHYAKFENMARGM
jgi:replicative DNA helicase